MSLTSSFSYLELGIEIVRVRVRVRVWDSSELGLGLKADFLGDNSRSTRNQLKLDT